MSSFTSASQHYADYRDMPVVVCEEMAQDTWAKEVIEEMINDYEYAVDDKRFPVYEARQMLPGAMGVNIIWTINARSLMNFLRLRLCSRNVEEMSTVALKVLKATEMWWPEFASLMGPPCAMDGKCNQGRMSCGKPWEVIE